MFERIITPLAEAFARVIQGIWDTLSTHAPGQPAAAAHAQSRAYGIPATTPLLRRMQAYIVRLVFRLDSLVQRYESGRIAHPRPRALRPETASNERAPSERPAPLPPAPLPRGNAWLILHVQRTAQYIGHVEAFLARPDARALIQAAPQAGRILRPLCHALGMAPPPWLRLPGSRPPPDPCPRRVQRNYRRLNPIPWLSPGQATRQATATIQPPKPEPQPEPAPPTPTPWRMVYE